MQTTHSLVTNGYFPVFNIDEKNIRKEKNIRMTRKHSGGRFQCEGGEE